MDDLISREVLLETPLVLPDTMTRKQALECFRNILSETPTIDAEPVRHGRWIKKPTTIKYISHSECSLCGSWQGADWMNYCPHCGAKMDGDANDDYYSGCARSPD